MDKKQKVIKGLECCLKADVNDCEMDCPYFNDCGGIYSNNTALMTDAIALLKALDVTPEELERLKAQEQEPLAPIERRAHAQGADDVWYVCRKCGKFLGINPYSIQLCPECGRAVKW